MSTFDFEGQEIVAEGQETVLSALLRHGVDIQNRCRTGACQSCLLRTPGKAPAQAQNGLDETLVERGVFMSCQAAAKDVERVERVESEMFPKYPAHLVNKRMASGDVMIFDFEVPGWQASPGRFVRLTHSTGVSRPYSIATPAWESTSKVSLHVRLIPGGAMSHCLSNLESDDAFTLEGPFGRCFYRCNDLNQPILLIGSGTGLAPLYGIATDALSRGHVGPITLFHGARTTSHLYFQEELGDLSAKYPNFMYYPCVESLPRDTEFLGSPLVHALATHTDLEGFKVYLCGNPELVRTSQKKCFLAGANLKDIASDAFEAASI